jgi:hypothetical protein
MLEYLKEKKEEHQEILHLLEAKEKYFREWKLPIV